MDIGEPVAATDADDDPLTYTLDPGEDGAEIFDIDPTAGQLRTKAALDFETAEFYYVRVVATDTAGGTAVTGQITINLNNVEEPGTVTLSSRQPIVGQALTATVSDPDTVSDIDDIDLALGALLQPDQLDAHRWGNRRHLYAGYRGYGPLSAGHCFVHR